MYGYGKKNIGAYFGDFGKSSKSVFRGFILMKLGFFGRLFPKSLHFLDKLIDNFCRIQNLDRSFLVTIAMYKGQFELLQDYFPFYTFFEFHIFFESSITVFYSFIFFFHLFLRKKTSFCPVFGNKLGFKI